MNQQNTTPAVAGGMTAVANANQTHSHNLSINSISSIAEPTTPPAVPGGSKLYLWETAKLNESLSLPSFDLDSHATDQQHIKEFPVGSEYRPKEYHSTFEPIPLMTGPARIDKDYLASVSRTPLAQLTDLIFSLAKDQYGCRFLQKRIDENAVPNIQTRSANFNIIFEQVSSLLYELIIDPFGNYLIQKLTDYCDELNLNLILETLKFNLFQISINQHGTRALQKIIDCMCSNYQLSLLVKGLKPYITELIKDLNGNHVIQKILNKYSPENCQFIYDSINENLLTVATHKHGCCVLQKCLNHVNPVQLMEFSNNILKYEIFIKLVNDQFGNYVLQYLISIDSIEVNRKLYNNFAHFGTSELCKLKFSSNVIEKLMRSCYNNESSSIEFSNIKFALITHILSSDLNKLVNDPYGNYVVQTLIDTLINPGVIYLFDLPRGGQILLPSLQMLLPQDFRTNFDPLQIQVIKKWFRNCKIVSSFGRRIQLKINILLSGVSKSQRKSFSSHYAADFLFGSLTPNQSMNANGEFILTNGLMNIKNPPNNCMSQENSIQFQNHYPQFLPKHYRGPGSDDSFQRQSPIIASMEHSYYQQEPKNRFSTPNYFYNEAHHSSPRNVLLYGEIPEHKFRKNSTPAHLLSAKQFVPMSVPYYDQNNPMITSNSRQQIYEPTSSERRHYTPSVSKRNESAIPYKGMNKTELVQQGPLMYNSQVEGPIPGPAFGFGNTNLYNQTHPSAYGKGQHLR